MKRLGALGLVVVLLLCPGGVFAAEVTGELKGEVRIPVKADKPWDESFGTLSLRLETEGDLDFGCWKATIDSRYDKMIDKLGDGYDDIAALEDDLTFKIDEAYVSIFSPLGADLDLRLGKQHVKLGTGDGITTCSLLEPTKARFIDEFRDTDGVVGARVDWYPGDVQVTGFWQPRITPAEAPVDPLGELGLSRETEAIDYDDTGMGYALKATRLVGRYDVGAAYQRGYVPAPLPAGVNLITEGNYQLVEKYMPMRKLSLLISGPLGDAGAWAELTYNKPEEDFFSPQLRGLLGSLPERYHLSDEAYVSGLIGADYFFADGTYVNGQIVRGFPYEYTESMVQTYFIGDAYRHFMGDRLKLEAKVVYCFDDQGWILGPEVTYQLPGSTKLWVKGIWLGGDDESDFGQMGDLSQVMVGIGIEI
jgi:hypothetical protein